jgi:hypothetical protein
MVSLILMTLIIHLNCSSHCSNELKESDRISFVITTAIFALFSFTILTFDVCLCFKEKSVVMILFVCSFVLLIIIII